MRSTVRRCRDCVRRFERRHGCACDLRDRLEDWAQGGAEHGCLYCSGKRGCFWCRYTESALGSCQFYGPVDDLLDALAADPRPSLRWAVAWSAGGIEPLQAAWDRPNGAGSMLLLLAVLEGLIGLEPYRWWEPSCALEAMAGAISRGDLAATPWFATYTAVVAEADGNGHELIRRRVPRVPPLGELVQRVRAA